MDWARCCSFQAPWIHLFWYVAPKPMSDASEYKRRSVDFIVRVGGIIDTAFHWGKNSIHHWMSALACTFRVTWWCMRFTVVLRSINLRENILPGRTTLQMCPSFPIRDFNSRLVEVLREFHLLRFSMAARSFSSGTSIVIFEELMAMPR